MTIDIDISKDERKAFIMLVPGNEDDFDTVTREQLNAAFHPRKTGIYRYRHKA